MNGFKKTLQTCKAGHHYYKCIDCPTCPKCEELKKPGEGFLPRRALENNNILTLNDLSAFSEKEILQLHGIGKSSIPKLKKALDGAGMKFSK